MDAAAWDERYAGTDLVWSAEPNQFVERELADLEPGRALDLGCGEGRNARWLAEGGWQVTAMDFSNVAVRKGRDLPDAIDWQVGDALTATLPRHLDLVLVAYLQLEAEERRPVLRRVLQALAPGGTLLVVAHDSTNLAEGTGGPQDRRFLFSAEDVLVDLEGLDLEVVRAGRVARAVATAATPSEDVTAWDALVRVVRR